MVKIQRNVSNNDGKNGVLMRFRLLLSPEKSALWLLSYRRVHVATCGAAVTAACRRRVFALCNRRLVATPSR